MGEYFELTFFFDKEKAKTEQAKSLMLNLLGLEEGKNKFSDHQYPLFIGREVLFIEYDFEDEDFAYYVICLEEFVFTKKNFEKQINQLLQIAEVCFSQVKIISFATGIYELTYYCMEGISSIKDFDVSTFSKYPILFFRKGCENGFQPSYIYNDVLCVVNIDAQDIFTNPVGELMEDEGLSFDEAHFKLYGHYFDLAEAYAKSFGMSVEKARKILGVQNTQQ